MAGPERITPEQLDEICAKVEAGVGWQRACLLVDPPVPYRTMFNYMTKGQDPDQHPAYQRIYLAISIAEAKAMAPVEETWRSQATVDWKAGEKLLPKKVPQDYGDRKAVEVSGPGGKPIQTENREMSWEEHAKRLRLDVLGLGSDDE